MSGSHNESNNEQSLTVEELGVLGLSEYKDFDTEPRDKYTSKTKLIAAIVEKFGDLKAMKSLAFKTSGPIKVFENNSVFNSYKSYAKKVTAIITHENKKITSPNDIFENIADLYLSLSDPKGKEQIFKTDGVEFVKIIGGGTFNKEEPLTGEVTKITYYKHEILTPKPKPVEVKPVEEIKEVKPVEEVKEVKQDKKKSKK